MGKKKPKIISLDKEAMKGVDHAHELYLDMNRSATLLGTEEQELIETARGRLEGVLGEMSSYVPEKATEDDILHLTRLAATALQLRNTIRHLFLTDAGYVYEDETVH